MEGPPVAADAGAERVRARRLLAVLVVVTVFVAHAMLTSNGVVVDDAYIAFRYARNLAAGAGFVFHPGAPPVEGYSCFSWVVLGAALGRLGLAPAASLPLVGIGFGAAVVIAVMRAVGRLRGATPAPPLAEVVPGLFLATSPGLAYYAGSGMETALYCLLVVLATTAALEGRPRRAAIAASLAILTRPEGVAVAGIVLAVGFWRAGSGRRRAWLGAAAATLAVALAYAAFKWITFGALLPNTALAKPPELREGLSYVGLGLVDAGPLLCLSLVLVARGRDRHAHLAWALGVALLLVLIAAVEGGDWMPAGRFMVPALCVAALALDAVACALAEASRRRAVAVLGAAAAAFYLYWSSVDTRALAGRSEAAAHYEPFRDELVHRMEQAGVTSVGTLDIGRISYAAPGMRILDLGGLTDREIAHAPGDYQSKHLDPGLLERKAPDAFLFTSRVPPHERGPGEPPEIDLYHPVEREVASTAWFRERYRLRAVLPVRSDYFLCWYQRVAPASP